MADDFDLKFQEIKNAIYFMTETIEKHYVENNFKIDKLADAFDKLSGTPIAAPKGIPVPPAPASSPINAELLKQLDELSKKIAESNSLTIKSLDILAQHFSGLRQEIEPLSKVNFQKFVIATEKLAQSAGSMPPTMLAPSTPAAPVDNTEVLQQLTLLKKQSGAIAEVCSIIVEELDQVRKSLEVETAVSTDISPGLEPVGEAKEIV